VRRILIVDDEPSVRDVMATVLMDAGFSVLTAADGHIALEIIDDASPDLIITDVVMPNLDGWALLDHAREWNPTLPIILNERWRLDPGATHDAYPGSRSLPPQAICHRGAAGARRAPDR
jgi:chemotaxis response regulator CheB